MLLFEIENDRNTESRHCLPTVDIKKYNVVIDRKNLFDKTVKNMEVIKLNYDILQEKAISDMIRQLHFLKIISILKNSKIMTIAFIKNKF